MRLRRKNLTMPTYDLSEDFQRDWRRLSQDQKVQFRTAIRQFVADLKAGQNVRSSFNVKRFHGVPGVLEFAWAGNGRSLFRYGTSPHSGDVHIVWLRIGTHDIYESR